MCIAYNHAQLVSSEGADLAVLTMTVKRRLGRSNRPFTALWAAGGEKQFYYRMDPENAELRLAAAAENGTQSCKVDS